MKAFLSDRAARREYLRAWSPSNVGSEWAATEEHMREAVHEARAILAESEPWKPGETTWADCGAERVALAESIARALDGGVFDAR